MSKNFLSFLSTAKVEDLPESEKKKGGTPSKKERQPAPSLVAIRLWRDGSVYPSNAAIDQFDLNYRKGTITKVPIPLKEGQPEEEQKFRNEYYFVSGNGQGFDVIDSRKWGQFKAEGSLLFVSPVARVINTDGVSKSTPKIDLFASVGYDEEGSPKTTVADQGAVTFGKSVLIDLVKELYDIELNEERPYIDLIITSEPIEGVNVTEAFSKDIAFYPKRVIRGEDKGKEDYIRRENTQVYALIPASILNTEEDSDQEESSDSEEQE